MDLEKFTRKDFNKLTAPSRLEKTIWFVTITITVASAVVAIGIPCFLIWAAYMLLKYFGVV